MAIKSAQSDVRYMWLIVFQWSHKTEKPFSIHVINPTFVDIVPVEWISGKLQEGHRLSKLRIATLVKAIPYSIFAKVEIGINLLFYYSFAIYNDSFTIRNPKRKKR